MKNIIEQTNDLLKTTDIETLESYVRWLKEGQKYINMLSSGAKVEQPAQASNESTTIFNSKRCHSGYVRYEHCMTYTEAKAIVVAAGLKNTSDFHEWVRAGNRPNNFPGTPEIAYKNLWSGWKNFLNPHHKIEGIKTTSKLSYQEAKSFLQIKGITSYVKLREWIKTKQRPTAFPSEPKEFYSRRGEWKGWDDFFGTSKASRI